MKTKLIKTDLYLLLIDEEAEINKIGTLIYENDTNLINITGVDYEPQGLYSKIIAYYPLSEEAKELNLPLLPNPFEEEPLMKQASKLRELRGYHKDNHYSFCGGFIEGYRAAQSKQFSLEDMKRAIEMAREMDCSNYDYYGYCEKTYTEEEIIQSLSTQRLPKEFISLKYDCHIFQPVFIE